MRHDTTWRNLVDVPRGCCVVAAMACCASYLYVLVPDLHGPLLVVAVWGSAGVGVLIILLAITRMVMVKTASHTLDLVNTALGTLSAAHGVWLLMLLSGFC